MHLLYRGTKDRHGALARDFVSSICNSLQVDDFVETGTYLGDTLNTLHDVFETLHSIELSVELYERACRRFAGSTNIRLLSGNSVQGLETVLPRLQGRRALIWLDAHYSGAGTAKTDRNTPVDSELEVILRHSNRRDVLMIDDLRYFCDPPAGFESHDALGGYPDARDIATRLDQSSPGYDVYALCDALLAIPRELRLRYTVSPVLSAITRARFEAENDSDHLDCERQIASASGSEHDALECIPEYLVAQSAYGLGGHYYYWRALTRLAHGDEQGAAKDFSLADATGVVPARSVLRGRWLHPCSTDHRVRSS